ncbi:WD repeat-containing protein 46 [Agrilus planipennis]|uniref:WD repeat-containing protein 46 n=1 Tax=Agrilus planipennis TaxID=224129 RepID=A0A7F5RFR7_AGRPL|nr:WD repeat-containing protein 46 [Agrilus planipennis]
MNKVPRYFEKVEDSNETQNKDIKPKKEFKKEIVFNIDVKPKPWGRRREDNRIRKEQRNPNKISRKNVKYSPNTKPKLWDHRTRDGGVKKIKYVPNPNPKFPGRVPIPKQKLQRHSRGEGIEKKGIRTGVHRKRFEKKEKNIKLATELAARAEILLAEDTGFLEVDAGESSTQFTQKEIAASVDITSATKYFELHLHEFGPYRAKYTRNGRHLLLGGKMGHVAAFDWMTKKLHCEINVMETVHDICWLHVETMFAVAQKNWVYVYDNEGIELHCLKKLNKVSRMEFLPYHFILATASEVGYLSWLDISIGQIVAQYNTNMGRLSIMAQNPQNAVLCFGHSKGVVTMWAPSSKQPLVKMLCHKSPLTALHIDPRGIYMATAAIDKSIKVWDVRQLGEPLQNYTVRSAAECINFSHTNMLALGMGNIIEVYRDCCTKTAKRAYLRHRLTGFVSNMDFCPFEDVLGVASSRGFTSLLVPGAGEPNFDAREANPFQTKMQRKEAEIKALLEKVPADLISLDPTRIAEVDIPTLQEKVEAKKKLLYLKPPKINFESKRKGKGRGGTVKMAKKKKIVQEQAKKVKK